MANNPARPLPQSEQPDTRRPEALSDVTDDGANVIAAEPATEAEQAARATSFGTFKPVGHVMVGLPSRESLLGLRAALRAPGTPGLTADELTPTETVEDMQALIDNASPLAGFGSEIGMMRRYLELARKGYSWLVVKADGDDEARQVADLAKAHGATLAVRYGWLTIEEMI